MNNETILKILKLIAKNHDIGVFPKDRIRKPKKTKKCAYVLNTDPHHKQGQHWVAVYINKHKTGYYFDSYGQIPTEIEFTKFLRENTRHWIYNDIKVQGSLSNTCLFFLKNMCDGKSMKNIMRTFSKTDFRKNDAIVKKFVKSILLKKK